jgi:hypothetical protein
VTDHAKQDKDDYRLRDVECAWFIPREKLEALGFPEPDYHVEGEAYWTAATVEGWMGHYFAAQRAADAAADQAMRAANQAYSDWYWSIDWPSYFDGQRPLPKFEPPE